MKKIVIAACALVAVNFATAQQTTPAKTPKPKKDWSKVQIDRAGDHIMFQLSSDNWSGAPDSISSRKSGFSRGLNFYVMTNKPFKSDPRWSVAFGLGISNSNIFFEKTNVDIAATGTVLPFRNLDSSSHFKKYKLATTFLEVPVEVRYTFNPLNDAKSWKLALGLKVGTLLNAHTKGKTLLDKNGNTIGSYTEKISRKTFFNSTRLATTLRIGYGHYSLFGAYSLSSLVRDGSGPAIKPYQIGITISGL